MGTGKRSDLTSLSGNIPGPGMYNFVKQIGSEGAKVYLK